MSAPAKILTWVLLAILVASCAAPRNSSPPQSPATSISWRETFRSTEFHSLPIGGLPGRAIGVIEERGLAFFEHDQVASLASWLTYESSGSNTTYRGYSQYTFKDGASIVALLEGQGNWPGESKGTLTFLRGTDRFLGIEGKAQFSAVMVNAPDSGGDTYVDTKGTYHLLQTVPPPPQ
jgi:hypothetical protein